jgi:hypothetical protein
MPSKKTTAATNNPEITDTSRGNKNCSRQVPREAASERGRLAVEEEANVVLDVEVNVA